ncbi:flagellin [Anoxybacillus sp. CHMUD]|uniref:flagellin N-terminal helical domain-containing protein n=1 Tax=Anoxybacillus sp. CHMUD TaxID=2508870 RepID=UPI001491E62E|nr:flagellin [Anoxybacillus sp. CHMUD]NNU91027.1 flagellar protein [Anoxybacillus sp. CHMUD]
MRINHNIQALNAYRNLAVNQSNTAKNLEKLSSGLRINRAADDAAGLAISEKMRSQIRGLEVAERNALDAISLIQTAEGALNEVHSILQRMRELAVQASNDTLEPSDRAAIQAEVDQLTKEIDRIADTTQFNQKLLFSGSPKGKAFAEVNSSKISYAGNGTWEGIVTTTPTAPAQVVLDFSRAFGMLTDDQIDGQIFTINGKTYQIDAKGDGVTNTSHIRVDVSSWDPLPVDDSDAVANINSLMTALKNTIIANDSTFSSASTITNASDSGTATDGTISNGQLTLLTTKNMSPKEANQIQVSSSFDNTKLKYLPTSSSTTEVSTFVASGTSATSESFTLSFNDVPKNGDILKIDNLKITFSDSTSNTYSWSGTEGTATINVSGKSVTDVLNEIKDVLDDAVADTTNRPVDALTFHSVVDNMLLLSTNRTEDGGSFGFSNGLEIQLIDRNFGDKEGQKLNLEMQIGANESETLAFDLSVMDAASLGLARKADRTTAVTAGVNAEAGIDVSSSAQVARAAISVIDEAIRKVSEERGKLGAYQNRLEHTINNLKTAHENLTSSESRIRDTDMAMEMTNFTKNNILNQAAQAMLAQSNQLPQGILQLLKS